MTIGDRPLFLDFWDGVLARWPSGLARGHAASEHGGLLEPRRTENESAIGCRARNRGHWWVPVFTVCGIYKLLSKILYRRLPRIYRFNALVRTKV